MDRLKPVNKEPISRQLTLRDMQHIVVAHSNVLGADETIDQVHAHFLEESGELAEALAHGDRNEVAGEIADIFIFLARLADQQGIDIQHSVWGKLERNHAKYPTHLIQEMTHNGMTTAEARSILKQKWNRADDVKYMK